MAYDYPSLFNGIKQIADYDREAQEFELRKKMAQAELKKSAYLDADKIGEQAFLKAAMGQQLTPQELAAAQFIDAKSGGMSFNPVTGEIFQKPRISDKIGLPGMQPAQTAPKMPAPGFMPSAPAASRPSMVPKSQMKFDEANIEAGRKRMDELIASRDSAATQASTDRRIVELLPSVGYTGMGGSIVGALDKGLTGLNMPNVIIGDPAAREALAGQSVSQWVNAVTPLKGALTEREGARFDQAVSGLTTTPEGIKLRAEISQALSGRAAEKTAFYQDWYQQNGTLEGADQIWQLYADQSPAITDDMLARAKPSGQATPAAGAIRAIPPMAVQELRTDPSPEARAEFDSEYGPGSAARMLGQ